MEENGATEAQFEKVNVTAIEAKTIFEETIGQAANPNWFLAKQCRVTASQGHKIARGRKRERRWKCFTQSLFDNKNMQYGKEMEGIAKQAYEDITSFKVLDSGKQ